MYGLKSRQLRQYFPQRFFRLVLFGLEKTHHPYSRSRHHADVRIYQTKTRFYNIAVARDLFGQRVIVRCWGGLRNRMGGMITEPLVRGRLREIDRERVARGYLRC